MKELLKQIQSILADYHCDRGFAMTEEHIEEWVNQFEAADREFILSEFLHILNNGVYISKQKAKELLLRQVRKMTEIYKYPDEISYLVDTVFLQLQPDGKSQSILLNLLDEVLQTNYGIGLQQCGSRNKKNYIYLDDVLATGKTVLRDCRNWLSGNDVDEEGNLKAFLDGKINFCIIVFCSHSWAVDNIRTSLKLHFKKDEIIKKLIIYRHYFVENQVLSFNPKLNLAYPINEQPEAVQNYLQSLPATRYESIAYRKTTQPSEENFFSSKENRIRFEQIVLSTGINILGKVKVLAANQRPLGNTYPDYKTFGTGTLFFTWSNISNTCPIVFWWDNPAHNWKGLFPLYKRGV